MNQMSLIHLPVVGSWNSAKRLSWNSQIHLCIRFPQISCRLVYRNRGTKYQGMQFILFWSDSLEPLKYGCTINLRRRFIHSFPFSDNLDLLLQNNHQGTILPVLELISNVHFSWNVSFVRSYNNAIIHFS